MIFCQASLFKMKYFFYILHFESIDHYYIGISENPQLRLQRHNTFITGWTRQGRPWKLVFQNEFESKEAATKWENWVKAQKKKPIIEKIIHNQFDWKMQGGC
jgi:putative endonuclease